jgi:hypothetical protein
MCFLWLDHIGKARPGNAIGLIQDKSSQGLDAANINLYPPACLQEIFGLGHLVSVLLFQYLHLQNLKKRILREVKG